MEPFNTEESGGSTIQRSAASARKTRLLGGYVSPLTDPARPVAGLGVCPTERKSTFFCQYLVFASMADHNRLGVKFSVG